MAQRTRKLGYFVSFLISHECNQSPIFQTMATAACSSPLAGNGFIRADVVATAHKMHSKLFRRETYLRYVRTFLSVTASIMSIAAGIWQSQYLSFAVCSLLAANEGVIHTIQTLKKRREAAGAESLCVSVAEYRKLSMYNFGDDDSRSCLLFVLIGVVFVVLCFVWGVGLFVFIGLYVLCS